MIQHFWALSKENIKTIPLRSSRLEAMHLGYLIAVVLMGIWSSLDWKNMIFVWFPRMPGPTVQKLVRVAFLVCVTSGVIQFIDTLDLLKGVWIDWERTFAFAGLGVGGWGVVYVFTRMRIRKRSKS